MDDNDDVLGTALAARWGSSPQPSTVCPTSSRVVMADDTQATVNAQLTIKESSFSQPVYQRESLWLGLKTGRENPVPTGTVYRLSRPDIIFAGKTEKREKYGKIRRNRERKRFRHFPDRIAGSCIWAGKIPRYFPTLRDKTSFQPTAHECYSAQPDTRTGKP